MGSSPLPWGDYARCPIIPWREQPPPSLSYMYLFSSAHLMGELRGQGLPQWARSSSVWTGGRQVVESMVPVNVTEEERTRVSFRLPTTGCCLPLWPSSMPPSSPNTPPEPWAPPHLNPALRPACPSPGPPASRAKSLPLLWRFQPQQMDSVQQMDPMSSETVPGPLEHDAVYVGYFGRCSCLRHGGLRCL